MLEDTPKHLSQQQVGDTKKSEALARTSSRSTVTTSTHLSEATLRCCPMITHQRLVFKAARMSTLHGNDPGLQPSCLGRVKCALPFSVVVRQIIEQAAVDSLQERMLVLCFREPVYVMAGRQRHRA